MFIFRYEHNRKACVNPLFTEGSSSVTGHGTFTGCDSAYAKPNFGLCGSPPFSIMQHERCAVSADQFDNWIGEDYRCRYESFNCYGADYCSYCPALKDNLNVPDDWDLIAYWVEDSSEGIDWRRDNGQIVFNPDFAICMGVVQPEEVHQLALDSVPGIY